MLEENRNYLCFEKENQPCQKPSGGIPMTDLHQKDDKLVCSIPDEQTNKDTTAKPPIAPFRNYIASLEPWEQRLLKKTTRKKTNQSLSIHIQCKDALWLVSDGGKEEDDGYYRWVIATDTEIIWEGRGYVQANKNLLETQQTEGVGHLAAALFLKHYCLFHGVTVNCENTAHCTDNKGIVGRME
eukprot:225564-Ditylum_brightwellii.AAC.1